MKHFYILCVLLVCGLTLPGQTTTITTYYVIAPTSGCNGVWAINNIQFSACSGGTYSMYPFGCAILNGPVSGDTMFLQLCAFPCDIDMINSSGGACICGTGTTVGVDDPANEAVFTTYPNPSNSETGWNIWFQQPGNNVEVVIYNSVGQLMAIQKNNSAPSVLPVNTSALCAGTYLVEIRVNGGILRQRLVLTQ
ncbi:MAG TPA: T9SS type A sorting domain-containing protein [Bacteroidia bacterium]|nr:T9SS type A sorting domain-containing protein [Bacteroidia bacterium]